MTLEEYTRHDALGLAELVRKGDVSAPELCRTALDAIDRVNPKINAVIETYPERAETATAQGPLGGVPFLRKDILLQEEGGLTEFGSRLAAGLRMPFSTDTAERYRQAGLITLGRTTTPEMGFNGATETVKDGPTRNPWNPDRSVGGSSGGSAAIVAAGAVPAAYGNDGGGSIRVPAGCCGCVGLKPSRGRVSMGPTHGSLLLGLVCEHSITRTVRDSAALLDAVQGANPGDPFVIPPPERPYVAEIGEPTGQLRIAVARQSWTGAPIDPEVLAALDRTALLCEELGHQVVDAIPQIDGEAFLAATRDIWCGFLALGIDSLAAATGRTPGPDTVEATTLACYEYGKRLPASSVYAGDEVMNACSRETAMLFSDVDVLLTPTIAQKVARIGAPFLDANQEGVTADQWIRQIFGYAPFTALFNATGQPAVSLPLEQDSDGLPIGLQFVGRFGNEALLFRLASALEEARPWRNRRPSIWAGSAH